MTTGSSTGTDNQYPPPTGYEGRRDQDPEVTDTYGKPALKDRIAGNAKQAVEKVEQKIPGLQGRGDTTTGSCTGTDNQYPITGQSHHKHHLGGNYQNSEVTGQDANPTLREKIVGNVEKIGGQITNNPGLYEKGANRAVSWLFPSVRSVLIICFEHQGWRDHKMKPENY